MAIRFFRISPQAPGVLNKHTGWLIGCPRLVWRGNLQGFGLVDYTMVYFALRDAHFGFLPTLAAPRTNTPRTTPLAMLV